MTSASTHENATTELMLEHLTDQGVAGRLDLVLVLVDRGVTAAAADTLGRRHALEVRRVGWDDKQPVFRPIRHAWRVEVAHGRLGRSRRLPKSFETTTISATGWLRPGRDRAACGKSGRCRPQNARLIRSECASTVPSSAVMKGTRSRRTKPRAT